MRSSFPMLLLLLFLGACGQSPKSYQPNSATTNPPNSTTSNPSNPGASYQSDSGKVSSLNAVTGYLQLGGSFVSPDAMGSGCYYGGCPAWAFTSYPLSYELPDGTTAQFTNFSGTADFTDQSNVQVSGTASGNDSTGAAVQVSVKWAWAAFCKSGRDGGCRKQYISGTLTVTK
jgi:hypothetical protein